MLFLLIALFAIGLVCSLVMVAVSAVRLAVLLVLAADSSRRVTVRQHTPSYFMLGHD